MLAREKSREFLCGRDHPSFWLLELKHYNEYARCETLVRFCPAAAGGWTKAIKYMIFEAIVGRSSSVIAGCDIWDGSQILCAKNQ